MEIRTVGATGDILKIAIQAMEDENPQRNDDYADNDGILRCGVCGKPKRARIDFSPNKDGSDFRIVPIGCDCTMKRMMEEETRKVIARLKQMREYGGISPDFTFAGAEKSPEMDKCWQYATHWARAKSENIGLLLWGDVGTGKTFAAHCICNELLCGKKPVCAFITSLSRALNSGWDKSEIVTRIRNASLVVFDDLGAERESEYALENVFMMVDERYRARKPLIVTTNLTLSEMREPRDIRCKRIYDRVLEVCVPIEFKGASRREKIVANKMNFARDVLGF